MQRKFDRWITNIKFCFLYSLLAFCLIPIILFSITNAQKFKYPPARMDNVVETYFGTKVADPYRWLENPDSPETQAWVEAENKLTYDFLNAIPQREKIKAKLTKLWNYPKYSVPRKRGGHYFYSKNEGLQNQSVYYMQESLDSTPIMVIDPNKLSPDGTIALTIPAFSMNGKLLAYGLSRSGSDWQEVRILNIDTGKEYPEVIKWLKFSNVAWKYDNQGFFYNRYLEPGSVPEEDQYNYNRVYYHKLSTPQSEDLLVYEQPETKEFDFTPFITEDGKYLVLIVELGTDPKNRIYYREVESNGPFIKLLDKADANYTFISNLDTLFYFRTDLDAPRCRIVQINIKNPSSQNWKEILPQKEEVIASVTMVNNQLVVVFSKDAHHQLKLYALDGAFIKEIELPDIGSLTPPSGNRKDTEMFFGFTSFLYPEAIFRYDFVNEKLTTFYEAKIDFALSGYESRQVFYSSKDGTRVPMFVVHKKGLKLDGNNPTLLYGYGGFNSSITPYFSISRLVWLENGGVFAVANIRGGDEYGEAWHQAGMLDKKQNVFDDFIAAAEWLSQNKYTSSKKLAISGGSNGGLLVAACMVQRPELFGAVICQVPVIDMLRYHKFTVGRYWIPEYGNAEANPDHFEFLYAYSPLHNVKKGVVYPPILITSADTDDRVVPAHAKKFAAILQSLTAGENPILLRVETKAGHGGGKPTSKVIEESSDIYAFLFKILGIEMLESQ
ncbi:MAG: prolyl oligopeptidase family serine peptidase [candidate division Zixibacteria bacterium]|nr:prolyl oligopeptidase family serine peptidase [candidate division Zixibacteria bacterium]